MLIDASVPSVHLGGVGCIVKIDIVIQSVHPYAEQRICTERVDFCGRMVRVLRFLLENSLIQ